VKGATPPPRLFVIIASEAEEAVVFRKGPADWCHIVRWDMARDTFHRGAWIKGRVYAERCDISPNGKLLLYFALQGGRWRTSYKGSYTAISRMPWLKAIMLWPEGDTWGGGGRFTSSDHVALCSPVKLHPAHTDRAITFSQGCVSRHASGEEVPGAQWSGRDHRGRIVFAQDGRIFAQEKSGAESELLDLRDWRPDPRPAPPEAAGPLQRYGRNGDI